LVPSVCAFLFVYEIYRKPVNGFAQIHTVDVVGPSLGLI